MCTTTNLSDFGSRERRMLVEILQAWEKNGLPGDFLDAEVMPMFNQNSGTVFLTNSDNQVAMFDGEKLESWYSCPVCGCEGYLADVINKKNHDDDSDCKDWVKNLKNNLRK